MEQRVKTLLASVASLKSDNFVKQVTKDTKEVTVVLGNEACDLDSGVSALVYGFFLHSIRPHLTVLPVLNIVSEDFVLKTELVHCLGEAGIKEEDLCFRDTLDLEGLGDKVSVILVDHNALADKDMFLDDKVVGVIDHHVKEREGDNVVIELVGSCATLVAEKIFEENEVTNICKDDETALSLLHKTILLDTVCLDEEAKRVTPKDIQMIETIEKIIGNKNRKEIFDNIWEAKQKVNHLTPHQLLRRDLKIVSNPKKNLKVAISSVPMPASTFIQLAGFKEDLLKFSRGEFICIVMGIIITEGKVTRDIFISSGVSGWKDIFKDLIEATEPNLELEKVSLDQDIQDCGNLFKQKNSAASRKQILPLVKKSINKC